MSTKTNGGILNQRDYQKSLEKQNKKHLKCNPPLHLNCPLSGKSHPPGTGSEINLPTTTYQTLF